MTFDYLLGGASPPFCSSISRSRWRGRRSSEAAMTLNGWAQIALFCGLVLLLTRPLGGYLDNVLAGRRTLLSPVLRPIEHGFYRLAGIDPAEEQSWWVYARAMIVFHIVGFAFLYLLLRCRTCCRSIRRACPPCAPDLAGNTAVSFLTNTNWQSYGGEIDHELSLADGRPLGSELPERRHRHRAGRGAGPRLRARRDRRASATSGPTWCAPRSTCCCRSACC